MTVTVREIAAWVDGRVDGDGDQPITGAAALTDARAGDITFLEQDRYLSAFEASAASAAIAGEALHPASRPLIRVKDPLTAFIQIIQRLHPKPVLEYSGIHSRSSIDPTAEVSADAFVGPGAVIGPGTAVGPRCRIHAGAVVGARCKLKGDVTLHPNVVLYDECEIGQRVTIHANAVIGADGFGYRTIGGRHVKVPQIGIVEIQDDVEIGAGTTIDRATFGRTVIGQGTKIDNLVMIGHNCRIGRHNVIVSQVGIAGSSSTGDYVVMAGQVGIADHCHIGDRTMLGAKCGVAKDVPADMRMHGVPAAPDRDAIRMALSLEKLPELQRQVKRILKQLDLKGE